jgi:predicted permease
MSRISRRVRTLLSPSNVSHDIDDEMRMHIQMEAEDLIRSGLTPGEAHRRAHASFGGIDRFTEEARDGWPLQWMQRLVADVRYAFRSLRHAPAFTATAIVSLAVGMGATGSVFSAVDSVAFRPLAVRDAVSLYAVYGRQGEASELTFSYPAFRDVQRGATAFQDVLAFAESPVTIGQDRDEAATAAWAAHTSDNYFSTLGLTPALGTFYRPGDIAAPVVVLSHTLWASRYNRDPAVIGRNIRINGSTFTITGVAPAQFNGTRLFTFDPALWIPAGMHAQTIPASGDLLNSRNGARFHLIGRLRDGVSVTDAQASVDRVARDLEGRFPDAYRAFRIDLVSNRTPINPWLASPDRIRMIGRTLLVGCLLVLLIACVNISSLLIARMTVRRQEMAVRLSLGASRRRLLQQLLTESVVLAGLGATVAIPVHLLALRGLNALVPPLEYASSMRPSAEPRVFAFGIILTIGAAIVFGLGPALQATRPALAGVLREANGRGGRRWARFRESLIVAQALVSALVLVAGALFTRSLQRAQAMDVGFALDSAITFTVNPELSPAYDTRRTREFYSRLESDVAALPGVRTVARAASIPLDGSSSSRRIFVDGGANEVATAPVAEFNVISAGFLAALGTPLIEGREFARGDTAAAVEPVVVNEVLAHRLWPYESPIGKHLRLQASTGTLLEVVGVAKVSMYRTLGERPRPALWLSLDRNPRSRTVVLVRGAATAGLASSIRRTVSAIDPNLPVTGVISLREYISVAYVSVESAALGATAFGILGLLLAASGIYGITSYAVSQRRREIGIRMALGARALSVVRLVTDRALLLTISGALVGTLIVAAVPMGLDSMLYGVARYDFPALAMATMVFAVIALIAAASAARRAVRVDPMRVLRLD